MDFENILNKSYRSKIKPIIIAIPFFTHFVINLITTITEENGIIAVTKLLTTSFAINVSLLIDST